MLSHWALALECTYGRLMVSSIWSHCISISNIQTLFIKLSVPASTGAQSITLWPLFLLIINQCLKDSLVSHPSVWLVKIHILTSEMPVDELERTVRQRRCKWKGFPSFLFPQRKLHNGVYSAFAQLSSQLLSDIFHFFPENVYLQSSEQTNTKGGTVYYFEFLRNKQK